ncbi:MAG: histidine phosphatase family protein [Oscillospiraceae bacterium]|nr:histidine phosphatase family protein [Oscillospiraceae bacterium]
MTNIYLVRHAQSEGNLSGHFQGITDAVLTPLGLKQAAAVGARLAEMPLAAVYASPLSRANQTANAIAAHHGLEVITEPDIIEISGGVMENVPFGVLLEKFPKEFYMFDREPHLFEGIEGAESVASVFARMKSAIERIAARHPGQSVAVVSHGCPIRCYLGYAKGYTLEQLGRMSWGKNTGLSHITFEGGKPALHLENDIAHIPEELLSAEWRMKE